MKTAQEGLPKEALMMMSSMVSTISVKMSYWTMIKKNIYSYDPY